MKTIFLAGFLVAFVAFTLPASADPVVVELFTSEGCSSCPPADAVLRELGERDDVIILAWHVDYWDRLGWTDPFGDAAYTERQRGYAKSMNLRSLYTPQMIVNGDVEFNGSDKARAVREIERAKELPLPVAVSDVKVVAKEIRAQVDVGPTTAPTRVLVAVTEDELESRNIPRGENRGRTLAHDGVVRHVETRIVEADGIISVVVPVRPEWDLENTRLVILAERTDKHGVVGAASVAVP